MLELLSRNGLFLLAHDDDQNMRPRIHLPTLGLGLAGATLLDLLLLGHIQISADRVALADRYDRGLVGDPVTDQVLTVIRAYHGPSLPLRELIGRLAPGLYERTLAGLVAAGVITTVHRRLGRPKHHLTDLAVVVRVRGALRATAVDPRGRGDPAADALCSLVRVLGLHDTLHLGPPGEVDYLLARVTNRLRYLAAGPLAGIPDIVTAVDHAAGDLAVAAYG